MRITVEQFVEVCSSNRAWDGACGIYTYPLNAQAFPPDCWKSSLTCAQRLNVCNAKEHTAWSSPSLALIKTLGLLAPSSTNPTALCSLLPQPNSLFTEALLFLFAPSSSLPVSFPRYVQEHLWPFVMNGRGWGAGEAMNVKHNTTGGIEGQRREGGKMREWAREAKTGGKDGWR